MVLQTIFNSNLNPTTGNLTARFTNATAFYVNAPLLADELELDVFLQVYFPTVAGERVRNLPLGKLKDGQIKLNEVDTETVVPIPNEFLDSGLEMALFFLASESYSLEVYVSCQDCTLCELEDKINDLDSKLNILTNRVEDLTNTNSDSINNLTAILNLILNAVGVPVPPALPGLTEQVFFLIQ